MVHAIDASRAEGRWIEPTLVGTAAVVSPFAAAAYLGWNYATGDNAEPSFFERLGAAIGLGVWGIGLTVASIAAASGIVTRPHVIARSDTVQLVEVYDKPAIGPGLALSTDLKTLALSDYGILRLVIDPAVPRTSEIKVEAPYGYTTVNCTWDLGALPSPGPVALPSAAASHISAGQILDAHGSIRASLESVCREEFAKHPLTYLQR